MSEHIPEREKLRQSMYEEFVDALLAFRCRPESTWKINEQIDFLLVHVKEAKIAVDALGISDEETLHTMHPAHEDCCGCVNIIQSADSVEVVFLCNECGIEVGRAAIPHE